MVLKLCTQCGGTKKYDDGVEYGLIACDRCYFGFEPDNDCPQELVNLTPAQCERLRKKFLREAKKKCQ